MSDKDPDDDVADSAGASEPDGPPDAPESKEPGKGRKELEESQDDLGNLLSSLDIGVIFLDRDLQIRRFTEPVSKVFSICDSDIGRPVSDLTSKVDDTSFINDAREVLRTLSSTDVDVYNKDQNIWFSRRLRPYRTGDDRIKGIVATYTDITSAMAGVIQLERAERQQRVIAKLGVRALKTRSLQRFFDIVCNVLAHEFEYDFIEILKLSPDETEFDLVAGVGWDEGLVGNASVPNAQKLHAGYTALHCRPATVQDFETEERFERSGLLRDHNVRSGINCIIGSDDDIWGVVGMYCKETRNLTEEDGHFAQTVANLISDSILRIGREEAVKEAEQTLRLALDAANMGVWHWSADDDEIYLDNKVRAFVGANPEVAFSGLGAFLDILHPDDRNTVEQNLKRAIASGDTYLDEFRAVRTDGEIVDLVARGATVGFEGSEHLFVVLCDTTHRNYLERHYELIARELDHRVKNLLATIMSMTRMIDADSITLEEFQARFQARMHSLANTHALLADAQWHGVTIQNLLGNELEPYLQAAKDNEKVKLAGPGITLEPQAAQCLSMAFHELTANATNYGALSEPAGRLNIEWSIQDANGSSVVELNWVESGGPEVPIPTRSGFGSKVVNELLVYQLHADVEVNYRPQGFRVRIKIPAKSNWRLLDERSAEETEPREPDSSLPEAKQQSLDGLKVFVVDDEWFVSAALVEALKNAGAEVPPPAASIEQAQAMIDEQDADCAVLDYNIAGRPIIPIARQLLEKDIPMVFVTGYGSTLTLPENLKHIPILPKPVRQERLVETICAALEAQSDKS